ncbi:hypothetical protein [Streptomyces sp. AS02]|uniref:hypothetical protein n=1 Tax=Streptomyces sp. AS02 TaxID=2938946 RepID=UPI002021A16F|nr:hypothetical protein [Streptomyces sp. AS02]MCL8009816.1 hypothetical protein [Streptomyces sp. AS02]
MADFTHRIVLRHGVSADDARFVAWRHRWRLVELQREEAEAFSDIWTTSDGAEIHLVDDRPIGTMYFTLRGEGSDREAERIREGCDVWAYADAVASISASAGRDSKMLAIYAAALTAPDAEDEALVSEFRAAARDSDEAVRQAVVIATSYLPWPGLVELIRTIRDTDANAYVREGAQILLEGIAQAGKESGRD